jgi:imidazolonepropionase-like amidohydrolase
MVVSIGVLCVLAVPGGGPIFIEADKILAAPGQVIEGGAILVEEGRIAAVGQGLSAPEGAQLLTGSVACPGFIDIWSAFGVESESLSDQRTNAATSTVDSLDFFLGEHRHKELLRGGITALRAQAGARSQIGGIGALVRNHPEQSPSEAVILRDCCVAMSVGVTRQGRVLDPFDRIAEVDKLAAAIEDGRRYLEDKIEYRHELEEWEKAIAEKEEDLAEEFKKVKKEREKALEEAKEKGKEHKEKTYKEDKRPKAPAYDADKEVLARVAYGELPLIVEAHRSAELRELLASTVKFDRLRLIVAGAAEGDAVAGELAKRGIPVIVWPAPRGTLYLDEHERSDLGLAGRLEKAGVEVLLGSGVVSDLATRDLSLMAALAVGHGLSREAAFEALTLGAARALDAADRIGSIESGKDADILILDGDPLSSTTRVRYAIAGGDVVFTLED